MKLKHVVIVLAIYELTVGLSEILAGVNPAFLAVSHLPSLGKLDTTRANTNIIDTVVGAGAGIAAYTVL